MAMQGQATAAATIQSFLCLVDRHLRLLLADADARQSIRARCLALLLPALSSADTAPAALSALRDAIDAVEAAILGRASAAAAEELLQPPALLEEDGTSGCVANRPVVAVAYFYLALARHLQGDLWQSAMHLLHAVVVCPELVRTDLTPPPLWEAVVGSTKAEAEATMRVAKRLRDRLMYHRVFASGGGTTQGDSSDRHFLLGAFAPDSTEGGVEASVAHDQNKASVSISYEHGSRNTLKDQLSLSDNLDQGLQGQNTDCFDLRCLQEILEESQSDSPVSFYSRVDSPAGSEPEVFGNRQEAHHEKRQFVKVRPIDMDFLASKLMDSSRSKKCLAWCSPPDNAILYAPESNNVKSEMENNEKNSSYLLPSRSHGTISDRTYSIFQFRDKEPGHSSSNIFITDETSQECSPRQELRCLSTFSSKFVKKYTTAEFAPYGSFRRKRPSYSSREDCSNDRSLVDAKESQMEFTERFEKAVSTLCISNSLGGLGSDIADTGTEVTTMWELLNNSVEVKQQSARLNIVDNLLESISNSKKDQMTRASVYLLLLMILEDRNIVRDIKKKEMHLLHLAAALKRNVHEAAIIIYLLDPTPSDIKSLGILPSLVDVACSPDTKKWPSLLPMTPTSASIAMIELLVTAFDYVTNNMHLATISSPQILSKFVNIARNNNLEEGVALAGIFLRCIRLNGNCKKFLSQATPVVPFLHFLKRDETSAMRVALEYFHEILRAPRSSVIHVLHKIRQQGGVSIMHTLMDFLSLNEPEHRILAANLLLHLDILEKPKHKSMFRKQAMEVLLESVSSEDNSSVQALAASVLSNLGGTFSWTGDPYTLAWLVKKAGVTSISHRNMIRNVEWLDPCLQDPEISAWSTRMAQAIIKTGAPIFSAVAKGLQSKVKGISHDCLVCAAWLGSEMATVSSEGTRYSACDVLLDSITPFLHPGKELDERILACYCVCSYTSGKGKQKLMNFSEGLRESLRRLSSVTWMAEELLRVTDYFMPSKPRVSCVHTQILEVDHASGGAVTALCFFRGLLHAGYSDGTIRAWEIKGQRAVVVREIREHKKAVTCFSLFEPEDNLLSGSSDKTIRVWKMVNKKLECIDVIQLKEAVQNLNTFNEAIIILTQKGVLKLSYVARSTVVLYKSRHVKTLVVVNGKVYLGCDDFSIQEVDIVGNKKNQIRVPARSWMIKKQPINSIALHKDWMYCAGATVEGATLKDWRRRCEPKVLTPMPKGTDVQGLAIVEDFIYLNCSRYPSIIQIWLREKQHKIGRLSAGSKVTSLLVANDTLFCGTETGLIMGWIPL